MPSDRRRGARYAFGGVGQLTDVASGAKLIASVSALNPFGCFVKTRTPFPCGTELSIRVFHDGKEFVASLAVVCNVSSTGMGISFGSLSSNDHAVLQMWLSNSDQ
jgi:hypothetical protein